MKRVLLIALGLGALAVVGVVLWLVQPDPTGMAIGRLEPAERDFHLKLWHAMQPAGSLYLREWSDALADPPDDPLQLTEAFNELAFAVTGPTGLWRKTVPNEYFGCKADPETPICQRLQEVAKNLASWDRLQERLSRLSSPAEARRLLKEQGPAMEEYLRTLVPSARGLEALQQTPYFVQNLASTLQ